MINYSFDSVKYMCDPEHGPTGMCLNNAGANATATILLQQQQQPQQSHQTHQHDQQSQQLLLKIEQQANDSDIKEQSNGKRKHCVWDYYDLTNGKANCRTCGRTISATTTLAKGHLKAFHTELFLQVEQKEEQRKELNPTNATPKRRKTPQLHDTSVTRTPYARLDISGMDYGVGKVTPTVRMSRTECFSAAHRLHNPDLSDAQNIETYGKCNNLHGHGHNYEWKVVLEGRVNPLTGMVYDLSELKRAMGEVMLKVDHKNLDVDNDYFRNNHLVSTTENLAVYLYHQIKMKLKPPEILKKVVVYETNKNRFSYSGG